MALIKCVECGMKISSLAQACPHCGCPKEFQAVDGAAEADCDTRRVGDIWTDVATMITNNGSKLEAITNIRNATGISLQEAYNIIEYIADNNELPDNLPKTKSEIAREEQLKKQPKPATCKSCRKQISTHTEVCPHCGNQTGVHVCPKCNSTNTETISGASKASSLMLFGVFAANKVVSKYRCRDCNHKF